MSYYYDLDDSDESSDEFYVAATTYSDQEENAGARQSPSSPLEVFDEMLKKNSPLNEIKSFLKDWLLSAEENESSKSSEVENERRCCLIIESAASKGRHDIIEMLMMAGDEFHLTIDFTKENPMITCIKAVGVNESDVIKCVQVFLRSGVDINAVDIYGNTALIAAADIGLFNVCCFLLENGADVNKSNTNGMTALAYACSKANREITLLLLRHNANKNFVTKSGLTVLDFAKDMQVRSLFHNHTIPDDDASHSDALRTVLQGLNLEHLCETLQNENIDLNVLAELDEEKLLDAGIIEKENRKTILGFFGDLRKINKKNEKDEIKNAIKLIKNLREHCNFINRLLSCMKSEKTPSFYDKPTMYKQKGYITESIRICDEYMKLLNEFNGECLKRNRVNNPVAGYFIVCVLGVAVTFSCVVLLKRRLLK